MAVVADSLSWWFRLVRVAIFQIWLNSNRLTGSIPQEISNFPSATRILLHENLFDGTIPASLATNAATTEINVANNQLTGSIPTELGQLQNLKILVVSSNRLTGSLPRSLALFNASVRVDLRFDNNRCVPVTGASAIPA